MAVLERSELEASPLSDLHAIANQIGLDGFRRLRKADLIDTILGDARHQAMSTATAEAADEEEDGAPRTRPRRAPRSAARSAARRLDRRGRRRGEPPRRSHPRTAPRRRRGGTGRRARAAEAPAPSAAAEDSPRARGAAPRRATRPTAARLAEGVVEVLGNGSAFLRVDPPEPSDDDVYISAAQVRRCELVSGDRVTGPVRTPRRSERYPSLVRVDTINGASADAVAEGARYEDLPVAWPERAPGADSEDPTLEAIEWLTPIGRGSRALIVGARHAGKTETLRALLGGARGREGLEVSLVLAGARPEEIQDWQEGPLAPVAALASPPPPTPRARRWSARSTPPSASPRAAVTRSC